MKPLTTLIALAALLAGAALMTVPASAGKPYEKRETITPEEAADGTWAALAQRAGLVDEGEDPFVDENDEPAGEEYKLSGIVFGQFFGGAWGVDDGRTVRVHAGKWELYKLNKTIPGVIVRLKDGGFLHAQKGEHGTRFIFAGIAGGGGSVNLDDYFTQTGEKWSTFETAVANTETGKKATFSKDALTQMGVSEDKEGNPVVPDELKTREARRGKPTEETKPAASEESSETPEGDDATGAEKHKGRQEGAAAGGGQLPASDDRSDQSDKGGPLPEWGKLVAPIVGIILVIIGFVVFFGRNADWGGHRPTPHQVRSRVFTAIALIATTVALMALLTFPALWATSDTPEGPAAQAGTIAATDTVQAPAEQPAASGQQEGGEPIAPPTPQKGFPWEAVAAVLFATIVAGVATYIWPSLWVKLAGGLVGASFGGCYGDSWWWTFGGAITALVAALIGGNLAEKREISSPAPIMPPPDDD